jgi:hypothetical protein
VISRSHHILRVEEIDRGVIGPGHREYRSADLIERVEALLARLEGWPPLAAHCHIIP